jgi:beta-lactamase superfamily II metal-dependent hydrolase
MIDGLGDLLGIGPFARALAPDLVRMILFHALAIGALNLVWMSLGGHAEHFVRRSIDADSRQRKRRFQIQARVRQILGVGNGFLLRRPVGFPDCKIGGGRLGSKQPDDTKKGGAQDDLKQVKRLFDTVRAKSFEKISMKGLTLNHRFFILPEFKGSRTSSEAEIQAPAPKFGVILALLFFAVAGVATPRPAMAAAETGTAEFCPAPGLVRRSGNPSCWAARGELCLSQALWLEWLRAERPASLCGSWPGKWQSFSPPLNDPGHQAAKTVLLRFHATGFPEAAPGFLVTFEQRVERLREDLHQWLSSHDSTGVLSHLATGTGKPGGAIEFLMILGFVHVLSASGIHLYAMARWWSWIFEGLARKQGIPLRFALPASRWVTLLSWSGSWILAGARPGMLRPWIVVLLRQIAKNLGIRLHKWAPLALALVLDLLVAAWRSDLHGGSGRWIYALACAGGLMARSAPGMAIGSWILAALWQSWAEGTAALATPLLSALTLPVFSVALYPSILFSYFLKCAGITALADSLAKANGIAAEASLRLLAQSVMHFDLLWRVSRWALVSGALLGAFALTARARVRLQTGLGLLLLRLLLEIPFSNAGANPAPLLADQVEQLDIGQGDAALVVADRPGLIDTGPEKALSDQAWLALLARRGIRRFDWIALTHLDEDHSGGLKRLARLLSIGCVATSEAELESERGRRYRSELEKYGIRVSDWSAGCVPFPYLAPDRLDLSGKANTNMGAVFVPLTRGGFYLSAGDADQEAELRIGRWAHALAARQLTLPAQPQGPRILKLSHHGSTTSSDPRFIRLMAPTTAWISSGVGNHFGHPAASVLQLLQKMNVPVRRTDQSGSLCTTSRGANFDSYLGNPSNSHH